MIDRLTAHVKAGGCASKLSPKILHQALAGVPRLANENVLVGYETSDDAGVFRISDDCALVQTVDFFTPVVDDPFVYGQIAAANALSDVYAMGGRPISALSIVAFPGKEDVALLQRILCGGADKMREAGCVILGGHSVNDEEIKFGYAVTGLIHPGRIWTNAGARPGDELVFTKRIGTGVIGTALKRGMAAPEHVAAAVEGMLTLNAGAAAALASSDVHACTDITGFSLLGHAREMALGSAVTVEIDSAAVPLLPGALGYAQAGALPGGLKNNRDFAGDCVELAGDLTAGLEDLLYDPQTSGGLLVSLPPGDAAAFRRAYPAAVAIGRVTARQARPVKVL